MSLHKIDRGLDVCGDRSPSLPITSGAQVRQVALLPDDYRGLRPRLLVEEGARVRRGDPLFEARGIAGLRFVSPGKGRVREIHRGAKRALQSVIVELDDDDHGDDDDRLQAPLPAFSAGAGIRTKAQLISLLCESGLWTALRTRPFGRVPAPAGAGPFAIFVTAIDTQPLAIDPQLVVDEAAAEFRAGLLALTMLTEGTVYLCVSPGSRIASVDAPVSVEEFAGPHPAGLVGVHIHRLAPVGRRRVVWSIGYQDVIAIGRLSLHGRVNPERVISIAGPPVATPRLVRTRLGASLTELTRDDRFDHEVRLISGSMLSGKSMTRPHFGYLGRYDQQLTVLPEDRDREFLGWLSPGRHTFSILPVFLARWIGAKTHLSTSSHGDPRAIVPIGVYERVLPMDILATFLLRALAVGDLERAEALGCLELDEEDLALCSFVCPSKLDYGPMLRRNLEALAREAR